MKVSCCLDPDHDYRSFSGYRVTAKDRLLDEIEALGVDVTRCALHKLNQRDLDFLLDELVRLLGEVPRSADGK